MPQSLSVKAQQGEIAERSEWYHSVSFGCDVIMRTRGGDLPCDHEVVLLLRVEVICPEIAW